ncbi:MAG: hypothetical protein ACC707_03150 [Thiohalomonadales bacterium]
MSKHTREFNNISICIGLLALMVSGALLAAPPYPQSPVFSGIDWAPANTIIRKASGSDTFPITWADDDLLYTAFGDGFGFAPQTTQKLSLGLASVGGQPATGLSATNIRTNTGEQLGQGSAGKKASSMLMVNGVLYMWARNADNNGNKSQLAWSTDHAKTWTWSNWLFNEFGYCVFLNFGKNYAGARDQYVYVYTPNVANAYTAADNMILMRVPKDQITTRSAYQFYTGVDGNNQPLWSSNITDRASVFSNPGNAVRSGITYNAVKKRYIWWQMLWTNNDVRFSGGFGVYDAPEPWGPWTTVYYTDLWDVGPGETASFPTKWMSPDGNTAYLVFSGDDYFSVRKATFIPTTPAPTSPPVTPTGLQLNIQ